MSEYTTGQLLRAAEVIEQSQLRILAGPVGEGQTTHTFTSTVYDS